MFLFKKKKETTQSPIETEKAVARPTPALAVKVVDKNAKADKKEKTAKGAPVRVVVPASELREDGITKPAETAAVSALPVGIPDDIADGLLVKVDPNPAIEKEIDAATVAAVLKPVTEAAVFPTGGADTPAPQPAPNVQPAAAVSASVFDAPKAEQPAKPAAQGEKKAEGAGNVFSNLFGKMEVDEETALDRLIKSLPGISIEEVTNQAQEVKSLISEWTPIQSVNRSRQR